MQELLKPFLLACESKNAKLASIALVSFQKLLANDAVSEEGVPLIISGLEQVWCRMVGSSMCLQATGQPVELDVAAVCRSKSCTMRACSSRCCRLR